MANLTVLQRTNTEGFPKAAELIEITGAHELEASDRAILNLLYQHAHDSGRLADDRAEWEIPIATLRASRHKGNERIRDSLDRLMRVVVTVPLPDRQTGEARILKTHLFNFVDLSAEEASEGATVRFGLPEKLQPILIGSNRWGRIKAEVVCAMTSKYAMALYELVQLRSNLDRCIETFPIDRFRDLMGVPPGRSRRGPDFRRFVVDPALLEVNGLSDVGVEMVMERRSRGAPIEAVTVTWWKKQGDEFRAAMRERNQSKIGRMARLRGDVEIANAPAAALAPWSPPWQDPAA
jgi:hypothetical protein